jgi:enoyl-CoA hydratase/carnithine racemase
LKRCFDTLGAMTTRTRYELTDGIATITMDDGKVNAVAPEMSAELLAHFDRAEAEEAKVVVLAGRERTLSAGFDLRVEPAGWPAMMAAGARLSARMLSFPRPVVVACPGNAIAMGAFLLLSADYRVGAAGDGRIGLNEVAIGLTLPWFAIEIARHRLPRPAFDRCTVTGVLLDPQEACALGFLDAVVDADELQEATLTAARQLATIDAAAHAATKVRIRREVLAGIEDGIARLEGDGREW